MNIELKDQICQWTDLLLHSDYIKDPTFINYVTNLSSKLKDKNISLFNATEICFRDFIKEYEKNMNNVVSQTQQMPKNKPIRQFVDGVFDIAHSGHMNALRRAKSLCDILVVGVCSDEEVTKFKNKPLMNVHERAKIPRACKWVDEVHVDDIKYYPTLEDLDRFDCQYMGHGDDLIPINGKVMYEEIQNAGRLKVFKRTDGISTTDIMGKMFTALRSKIKKNLMNEEQKNMQITEVYEKIDKALLESKDDNKTNFKLLNTSRRIIQFSNKRAPSSDDKIIYTAGAFDVLNCGHIDFLEQAKKLGTYLIVGIYDDSLVSETEGQEFPIQTLDERVLSVLALKHVDEVIIGAPWNISKEVCRTLKCDQVVECYKTSDIEHKTFTDPNEYPKSEGIFKVIRPDNDFSLNTILDRLTDNYVPYLNIYQKKIVRQEVYYNQHLVNAIKSTKEIKSTDD